MGIRDASLTDYGLRITDYGLRITDYGLRITDYGLRIIFRPNQFNIKRSCTL
ncbi:hypothetical protein ONE56_00690 [Vibrio mytili]|uniref:hypothetical protein n=1 Tax=Vibrio mytili TaxID=50718 RepID=UPI003C6FBC9A